jgi:hypothetical protein
MLVLWVCQTNVNAILTRLRATTARKSLDDRKFRLSDLVASADILHHQKRRVVLVRVANALNRTD